MQIVNSKIKNVFIWGSFDILHDGHIKFIEHAKKLGNVYVILIPDRVVKKYKKSYYKAIIRKKHLLSLGLVKNVFIDALPNIKCFDKVAPDIFVFGYDQNKTWNNILKKYILERFPTCKFKTLNKYSETHSSHLKEKMVCYCGSGDRFINCHGK